MTIFTVLPMLSVPLESERQQPSYQSNRYESAPWSWLPGSCHDNTCRTLWFGGDAMASIWVVLFRTCLVTSCPTGRDTRDEDILYRSCLRSASVRIVLED